MMPLLRLCSAILLLMPFMLLGIEVWAKYPSNHGGGQVLFVVIGMLALLLNILYMALVKRLVAFRVCAFALLAVLLYACDRFNVHITYEKWIKRGMPEWGCREGVRSP